MKLGKLKGIPLKEDCSSSNSIDACPHCYGANSMKEQYDSLELVTSIEELNKVILKAWEEKIIYCSEHKINCSINGKVLSEAIASNLERILKVSK